MTLEIILGSTTGILILLVAYLWGRVKVAEQDVAQAEADLEVVSDVVEDIKVRKREQQYLQLEATKATIAVAKEKLEQEGADAAKDFLNNVLAKLHK